jgi:DNA repair protein RecN (Recombination protein N)
MLRFLSIRQLALIDALEVEFGPGLSVLTGETGAGKSIIIEGVELLLGGRASADLVRSGAETAVVQAVVEDANGTELLLRREVTAAGRSRAFVDGNLVTSSQLRELTGPLFDLHGQHEHQTLLAPSQHLGLLDAYARIDPAIRAAVAAAFDRLRRTREALEACHLDERERLARLELLRHQLGEIEKVDPSAGEDDALSVERDCLANADRLQQILGEAYVALYEGDGAALAQLGLVWKRLNELAGIDPAARAYLEQREGIRSQLEDLALFLRSSLTHLEASPERLQHVEDRLAQLERLKKRHGPTLADVLHKRAELKEGIEALETTADRAAELEAQLIAARAAFVEAGTALSARRREAATALGQALQDLLGDLAMPHTTFSVQFTGDPSSERTWTALGMDSVEFFFSANPGEAPRALARIASGGELSRVMLALKTLATTDAPGKTLIFDEVDAGIGGRVADVVGKRLRQLGAQFQVLCITHLAQVAAHGHVQYRVTKQQHDGRALTRLDRLNDGERVQELARMMGGTQITPSVLASAEELLTSRAKGEHMAKGESESRPRRPKR